jgi:hypothetical protein
MSKKARVFVPLTKVDEEQRLVYGRITQEILDKSGEVMDYETSKPNFQKWSDEFDQKTGGLSKGNLRVMHGLNVAGKLTDIAFDDEEKAIDVCAKVVDDGEWEKVLEGCYTGFSVGGRYGKKWNDTVDGQMVKRYTAVPGEVSLVDDPCVGTATFDCVKADGSVMQKMFKAAGEQAEPTPEPAAAEPEQAQFSFTNEEVVEKATEMAKAAKDGSSWMDHVTAARDELMKAAGGSDDDSASAKEEGEAGEGSQEETPSSEAADDKAEKVTPPGVKQVWTTSDGTTFEKKADAEAHEDKLQKGDKPKTEAELLAERLNKAISPPAPEPEVGLWEDFGRLSKVVSALVTPFDGGQPKLEKGMYTVNRFSNILSDLASLAKSILAEGQREGDEGEDTAVAADIKSNLNALAKTFLDYTQDQVTELLAGMDDEVVVEYYDYYYNVAKEDGADQLAKDVCSVISDKREESREKRENLAKLYVVEDEAPELSDELSPTLQKRFDELTAENASFKKIAEDAVAAVETLTKRVETIEETPLPRAPNGNVAFRDGDFLKSSKEEQAAMVHDLLKSYTPEQLSTMMIKAVHAGGGQKMLAGPR